MACRLATMYSIAQGGRLARTPDGAGIEAQSQYVDGPRVGFSVGAGLASTATDYGRFLQMLLNGGTPGRSRHTAPPAPR